MTLIYVYEAFFFSLFKPNLISLVLFNDISTTEIFMVKLVLLDSMLKIITSKKRDGRSKSGKIADPLIYFQSFSNLYSAINIAHYVQ